MSSIRQYRLAGHLKSILGISYQDIIQRLVWSIHRIYMYGVAVIETAGDHLTNMDYL